MKNNFIICLLLIGVSIQYSLGMDNLWGDSGQPVKKRRCRSQWL